MLPVKIPLKIYEIILLFYQAFSFHEFSLSSLPWKLTCCSKAIMWKFSLVFHGYFIVYNPPMKFFSWVHSWAFIYYQWSFWVSWLVSRDEHVEGCQKGVFLTNCIVSQSSVQDKKSHRTGRTGYSKIHYSEKGCSFAHVVNLHAGLGGIREGTTISC